jgi:cytochrome c-type biogenesis protein
MDLSNVGMGIALFWAFIAGLASFLSPCVLPLVPAYIGYLGGRSAASTRDTSGRQATAANHWITFSHGVAFVLGFSAVFVSLGLVTSAVGGLLYDARYWLGRIGGVIVIIFGLHMTGIIRLRFLEYDLRPQSMPDRQRGYLASFFMGIIFSAGWSPCVGPILGSIMMFSVSVGSLSQGLLLLAVYSAGLAIPFLIASVQIGLVTTALRRYGKIMHYVEVGMGVIMIIVGILLILGRFERLASLGAAFYGSYDELMLGRILLFALAGLVVLGLIPAIIAYRKGRNFITWWLFGATLFPVALPAALWIGAAEPEEKPVPES